MPVIKDVLLTVPYSASGSSAINTDPYNLNNKPFEVGLASFMIYVTGGTSPPATIAFTHQFKYDVDGDYYGVANNVNNDSSVNTLALSAGTAAKFEASLNNQNWWKFSRFGGRIVITPSGAGDYTINAIQVSGI